MALDYYIDLESDISEDRLLDALRDCALPHVLSSIESVESDHPFLISGAWGSIFQHNLRAVQVSEAAFGLTPKIGVAVRLDTQDMKYSDDDLVKMALRLFERIPDKGVLTFLGERALILRDGRAIIFNSGYCDWDLTEFPTTLETRIEHIPVA